MTEKKTHIPDHGFPPFINGDSEILILGSFPSVKSREQDFFYMHPQNRFWAVLARIFDDGAFEADCITEKKRALKKHRIALYDVIESCDITGSKDSSITNVKPADIETLIAGTKIRFIALNGKKAASLFKKYNPALNAMAATLPSTSPANAQYRLEDLVEHWKKIID